jgi:hypothetical protein
VAKRKLVVEIVGDDKSLSRALDRSKKKTGTWAGGMSKKFVGVAAGFASIGGASALLKSSVSQTEALAKSTAALARLTGQSTEEASRWVEVAKVRGVEGKALNMGFITLAKNIEAANAGGDTQAKMFKELGVSQKLLESGKSGEVLAEVADAFERMPPGAQKAATAQKLFGRQAQTLLPVLDGGSKKLREQLALSDKYGTTLSKNQVEKALEAAAAQREINMAMDGVKIAIATKVLPIVIKGQRGIANFFDQIRRGTGVAGEAAGALKTAFTATKDFIAPGVEAVKTFFGEMRSGAGAGGAFVDKIKSSFSAARDWIVTAARDAFGFLKGQLRLSGGDLNSFGRAVVNVGKSVATAATIWGKAFKFVFGSVIWPIVKRVIPGVVQIIQGGLRVIGGIVKVWSGLFTGDWRKVWQGVKQIASGQIKIVGGIIRAATAPIRAAAALAWRGIAGAARAAWNTALGVARAGLRAVLDRIKSFIAPFRAAGGLLVKGLVGGFHALKDRLANPVKAALSGALDYIKGRAQAFVGVGKGIVNAIVRGIKASPSAIVNAIKDLVPGPVKTVLKKAGGVAGDVANALGLRKGGYVSFQTGGLVPSVLSPGEVVVEPTGSAFRVPGTRVAADTVPMMLKAKSAVLTDHGQGLVASGASIADAVTWQMPHFRKGGEVTASAAGIKNTGDWSRAQLDRLGIRRSATSIYDLKQWAAIEGGHWHNTARYNPLNTTMSMPGATAMNSHGVKAYKSWAQGLAASTKTLQLGSYKGIMAALRRGTFDQFRSAVLSSPWGTTTIPGGPGPKPGTGIEASGRGSYVKVTQPRITRPLLGNMLSPLAGDAASSIDAGRTNASRLPLLTEVLEGIVPESDDRPTREKVSFGGSGRAGVGGPALVGYMARRAAAIDAKKYPYSSPGNRSFGIGGPMDCSGAVSKVIGPKLLSSVQASPYFLNWGQPGEGKHVTTYSRGGYGPSGHVFMKLGGKYFGTSGENPGGGAGWFSGGGSAYRSGFTARHPKGMRKGGMVGGAQIAALTARLPKKFRTPANIAEIASGGVMPGMRTGGTVVALGMANPRKPKRKTLTVTQLVKMLGGSPGTAGADALTRKLAARIPSRPTGRLFAAERVAKRQIRGMSRQGFTGSERIQTGRLRGALSLLKDEQFRRVGAPLGLSDQDQERISRAESNLGNFLTVQGIDPESTHGLQVQQFGNQAALATLKTRQKGNRRALRLAKRTDNPEAIAAAQAEFDEVADQMLGLKASIKDLDATIKEQSGPKAVANMELALAQLTDTLDDDIAAQKKLTDMSAQELDAAKASGDVQRITAAAEQHKQNLDAMKSLQGAIEESTSETKSLREEMEKHRKFAEGVSAIEAREAIRFMADMVSGQVGAAYSQRSQTPSDGSLARY